MIKNRRAFIVGIKGLKLQKKEIFFLKKYKPWGIILFSRNIKSINQVKKLNNQIRKIFKDINYPILIDQEGGKVSRLSKLLISSCFTGEFFGKKFLKKKIHFNKYLNIYIDQISFLLRNIGVNINNAPVLDLRHKKSDIIIGDRAFSSNKGVVAEIGRFYIKKYHKNKIATVIKHIPGHGLANKDSHFATPVIDKKLKYLLKNDFYPFKNQSSLFAMTAHVLLKKIDEKHTVTHSKKIISIIRSKIKFKNIIISDDISMKALKFSIEKNTIQAFKAGCNIVLHCNANMNEMLQVAKKSPKIDNFLMKKTLEFYKLVS